ncbi:fatty-acyl-CoA synthase [Microtetraspora sp. NBRC 13810]|uniref:AMP-binding protein n=1 Tax=Microtetraspora sp. NBRC 13810 TaxID=3030990 RepID=UPI0024A5CCE1|nr:class I adenylate-forming enzyme family protein [Microtetraspora sp. NBRC 13810]GLW11164.1 fatty-acyl-CoA synthase [Microtetraspora sp. NBRC 13810]
MNDIVAGILDTARRTPHATAVIDARGRTLTYEALHRRVLSVLPVLSSSLAEDPSSLAGSASGSPAEHASGGSASGGDAAVGDAVARDAAVGDGVVRDALVGDGGRGVLFAVRPGVDAVVLALAAVGAGGMLMLAEPGVAPEVFAGRLAATRPRWVIAESALYLLSGPLHAPARRTGLLLPRLGDPLPGHPVRHLHTGRRLPGVPRHALSLRRLLRHAPAPAHTASAGGDHPAVVVFTSGTTGRPKGVVHTRGSLARGLAMFGEAFPLGPGDVVHTDQLMLGLPALTAGATWSLPGRAARFAGELAERRATHTFCVPVRLDALLRRSPRLPDTLRHLLLGAAPAPPAVLRRALAAAPGARVTSVYAMTEALPIAVASAQDKLACPDGDLLGAPLPGVGVRIADDGELFVSGPHLALGYLGEPAVTEVATGDLVRLDGRGRLVLLGRKKDMILRDGVNIYPGLYEPAIAALPGVAEAAIVGLADPETGDEEVVLAVVPAPGFDEARLRKALPDIVDAGALPDRVAALPALPRSGRADKLDRAALRTLVGPGPS